MMEHVARGRAEWCTTLVTLAKGADLLLVNKGGQGRAAIVAEYHGVPLAVLRFFPTEASHSGGMLWDFIKDAEDAQKPRPGLAGSKRILRIAGDPHDDALCFPEMATEWAKQGGRWPFEAR